MIMISMVFLTIAEAIMNRFTMSIIARSMEISIRRIHPSIIRRVARTPQEEGSDQDVEIRWVSKKTFDFFYFWLMKIRNLVSKFCLSFGWCKNSLLYFWLNFGAKFSFWFVREDKKTQNSKMLEKNEKCHTNENMVAIESSIKINLIDSHR